MTVIPQNDKTNAIYRLYGKAAHHCFNIELCCAFLLRGPELRKNHKLSELSPEIIEEVGRKLDHSTLGQLTQKINIHFSLTSDDELYLEKVLDKGNYLIHKFFGTYGKRMSLPETWPEMINELQELLTLFEEASSIFEKWSGIKEFIEQIAATDGPGGPPQSSSFR